eukprot:1069140-Pleurochrysis_carterae.AAC.1
MRAYWYPPCKVRTNGPAMSAWIRRLACDGLYRQLSCGNRAALASVQASQPSWRPRASAGGASAVIEGSARRREDPECRAPVHMARSVGGRHDADVMR